MKCYTFVISEQLCKRFTIQAKSEEEAREALEKSYESGADDFVLGADDHIDTEIIEIGHYEYRPEDVYKIGKKGELWQ